MPKSSTNDATNDPGQADNDLDGQLESFSYILVKRLANVPRAWLQSSHFFYATFPDHSRSVSKSNSMRSKRGFAVHLHLPMGNPPHKPQRTSAWETKITQAKRKARSGHVVEPIQLKLWSIATKWKMEGPQTPNENFCRFVYSYLRYCIMMFSRVASAFDVLAPSVPTATHAWQAISAQSEWSKSDLFILFDEKRPMLWWFIRPYYNINIASVCTQVSTRVSSTPASYQHGLHWAGGQ